METISVPLNELLPLLQLIEDTYPAYVADDDGALSNPQFKEDVRAIIAKHGARHFYGIKASSRRAALRDLEALLEKRYASVGGAP